MKNKKLTDSNGTPIKLESELCQGKPRREEHIVLNMKWVLIFLVLIISVFLLFNI